MLNGRTARGTRPEFSLVSVVSTGALVAPFAFLGAAYDATLRDVYTSGIGESILDTPNFLNALFGSGLFGNSRLRELVARYVDQDMLAAIAVEHAMGRRLFIATTNLDTQHARLSGTWAALLRSGRRRRWAYLAMSWRRRRVFRWSSPKC